MKKKDVVAMSLSDALKAARTAIRLKHTLAADAEINDVLPQVADAVADAAAKGKPFTLDVSALFSS